MKRSHVIIAAIVAVAVLVGGVLAMKGRRSNQQTVPGQPMGTPPAGAPAGLSSGGPPGSPSGAQSAEFQKAHKYALQLMKLVGNVGRLEEQDKASLTPVQAKSILAILEPLRKQDSLDEPAARKAVIEMQSVLTDEQRAAISALPPLPKFRQGNQPPGPPPSGAPVGPPPGVGPKPTGGFNPLRPPEGGPDRAGSGGIEKLFDALKKTAAKS